MLQSIFLCKICKQEIRLDLQDENSYISKAPHETFFGMELSTYRVKHEKGNEAHINAVILDHKGLFRGHLDAFVEIIKEKNSEVIGIRLLEDDITEKKVFSLFYVFDRSRGQVMVYENIETVDSLKLIDIINNKIDEAKEIYQDKKFFTFIIADLTLDILIFNGYTVIYQVISDIIQDLSIVINNFITHSVDYLRHDSFLLGMRLLAYVFLNTNKRVDNKLLIELSGNPLIFGKIDVKYPVKLPRIISKLAQEFPLNENILNELFNGETTIHQILLKYPDKYPDIRAMIDYINRRKILE